MTAPADTAAVGAAVTIVVPTIGRPSLSRLLDSLAQADGDLPQRVLLVDDRARADRPLLGDPVPERLQGRVEILAGPGRGPAAARNVGWRAADTEWVAFLDDDVLVEPDWPTRLAADLHVTGDVAGSQGGITVPMPTGRRPTDWERNVAGLAYAQWATADMAYRRDALVAVGGFDERFPRAYREDADLGLRLVSRGWHIVRGERGVRHPVRPAGRWVSVTLQRGNADDALLRARHGSRWRTRAGIAHGRRRRHLATTAALLTAAGSGVAAALGRKRGGFLSDRIGILHAKAGGAGAGDAGRGAATGAAVAGGIWAALTGAFAWERIAPGPRTPREIATMLATSCAIPPTAVWHWLRGWCGVLLRGARPPGPSAVLFDRDGTLVVDVAYNGDPSEVELRAGARDAIALVRRAGIPTAVVSNQSGVARGLITREQVDAVNDRIEDLVGPLGPWSICPHGPDDGCACRKPRPGLIHDAARRLDVDVRRCVVIGDIGSDVAAAHAAGARAVLVPTAVTAPDEVAAAPQVADSLVQAVELALGGAP